MTRPTRMDYFLCTNSLKSLERTTEEQSCSHERFLRPRCLTEGTAGCKSQVTLTLMAFILEGSLSANCLRTCLAAKPNEHKPWRMGALKPDQRAFLSTAHLRYKWDQNTSFDLKYRGRGRHLRWENRCVDPHLPWQQSWGLYEEGSSLHSDGTRPPVTTGEMEIV